MLLGLVLTEAPTWAHVLAAGVWVQGVWLARIWQQQVQRASEKAQASVGDPVAGAVMASVVSPDPETAVNLPESPVAQGTHMALDAPAEPGPEAARDVEQDMLRYALSHDLRAPLRVIDGFTRIVKEDYGRHLDRLGQDHLERVLAASARMNGMIDAVLAQAQLAGVCLAREDVDLSALAREVGAELLALQADAPSVQLQIADGLRAQADAQLVRRVLENLLGNALKYSAKVDEPRVELGCMPATNPPVYFVRDNGAGFDMQHADKLFGMFQRLHSAKDFPGTGVGLAGVRNIVRRHGGRVWAEAQPGQGACFYFTLIGTVEAQRPLTA
ncbi:sensor histidine kinase [Aquabacterium commune]|uniref:sensor histidine kinase n=1 Tax=Aquabacterium commune TaxID=70586 RepID=UPI001414CF33|nr:ATP-binding protein [Aquabacterium commune]